MKTSLLLLFATVVPFGWVLLGAIALGRFLMALRAKTGPENVLLSLLPRDIHFGGRQSRFGLRQFKQLPITLG